jgi:uridine phosphorylase
MYSLYIKSYSLNSQKVKNIPRDYAISYMELFEGTFRDSSGRSYHIRAKEGTLSPYSINAGSPERVESAVSLLSDVELINKNRGLYVYNGHYGSLPVTLFCTGMGPGSAEIAYTEYLANVDYGKSKKVFSIRVGTAGSWSSFVNPGDFVAETGLVRNEGASLKIAPLEWPARTDTIVLLAIAEAVGKLKMEKKFWFGPGITKDTLYADEDPERRSALPWMIEAKAKSYEDMGAVSTSMESSVMALLSEFYSRRLRDKGIRVGFGSILLIVSPYYGQEKQVEFKVSEEDELLGVKVALKALEVVNYMQTVEKEGKKIRLEEAVSVLNSRLLY